jgi:putative PIN family toxin of toxin-antitoxin system
MKTWRVVIDTNVLVAALRSRRGASYRLMRMLGSPKLRSHVSVPLVVEYERAAKALLQEIGLEASDVDDVLDYMVAQSAQQKVFFLWRPCLKDPDDDMVLELAVAARCEYIVTFNLKDFKGSEAFGVAAITPREFLARMGELR